MWESLLSKAPVVVISTGASTFQVNVSKLRRPWEELPESRERTGAFVLWVSCEGQIEVWELF